LVIEIIFLPPNNEQGSTWQVEGTKKGKGGLIGNWRWWLVIG